MPTFAYLRVYLGRMGLCIYYIISMSCKAILRECVAHCEGAVCDAVRDGNGTVGGGGWVKRLEMSSRTKLALRRAVPSGLFTFASRTWLGIVPQVSAGPFFGPEL